MFSFTMQYYYLPDLVEARGRASGLRPSDVPLAAG